jgi:poly(A) polymerase
MGEQNFIKLCTFGLNKYLVLSDPNKNEFSNSIMIQALRNTDERIKNNQSVTPGFLMAALLWPILISKCSKNGEVNIRKFFRSMDGVLREQQKLTAVPRKFNSYIKDIWVLQLKLHSRIKSQPYKTIRHPRFRAAYDFLLVRERASADKSGLGKWWTDFQKNDDSLRGSLISRMNEKTDEESSKIFGFFKELR